MKSNNLKELIRFLCINLTLFLFNFLSFKYFLINSANYEKLIDSISYDFLRFLNINLTYDVLYFIFLFFTSFLVTLLVLLSNIFNNPYGFKSTLLSQYIKIFQITTLCSVFIFYFLRAFNLSRFYLILYLFLIPLIFLFFQSEGFFSKAILRQHSPRKYIFVNLKNTFSNDIFDNKYFTNKEVVKKIEISSTNNLYEILIGYQKKFQFDFLVINAEKFIEDDFNFLIDITKLKKPVYLIAEKNIAQTLSNKLVLKKLNDNYLNIYFINPIVQDGIQFLIKRILDLVISIAGIAISILPIIAISLFIYLQDRKNPIIKIPRSGLYGKSFEMYKLRTMKPDSHVNRKNLVDRNQRSGPLFKIPNDPRVYPKLSWIRKYSIDELPQLINVLKGEMSIVGPRPLFVEDLKLFRAEETMRLSVLPGITGLLQINNRETENFDEWYFFDKKYIDNWSIWLDLKVIFLTPFKLKSSI